MASVSGTETRSEKYIATSSATYGATEVNRHAMLRRSDGRAYPARASIQ